MSVWNLRKNAVECKSSLKYRVSIYVFSTTTAVHYNFSISNTVLQLLFDVHSLKNVIIDSICCSKALWRINDSFIFLLSWIELCFENVSFFRDRKTSFLYTAISINFSWNLRFGKINWIWSAFQTSLSRCL